MSDATKEPYVAPGDVNVEKGDGEGR